MRPLVPAAGFASARPCGGTGLRPPGPAAGRSDSPVSAAPVQSVKPREGIHAPTRHRLRPRAGALGICPTGLSSDARQPRPVPDRRNPAFGPVGRHPQRACLADGRAHRATAPARASRGRARLRGDRCQGPLHARRPVHRHRLPRPHAVGHRLDAADARRRPRRRRPRLRDPRPVPRQPERVLLPGQPGRRPQRRPGVEQRRGASGGTGTASGTPRPRSPRRAGSPRSRSRSRRCASTPTRRRGGSTSNGASSG